MVPERACENAEELDHAGDEVYFVSRQRGVSDWTITAIRMLSLWLYRMEIQDYEQVRYPFSY